MMEELLAMKDLSVVTFGLAPCYRNVHVSTTMGERGKGAKTALCFVIDLDILPPSEIMYIMKVFEA